MNINTVRFLLLFISSMAIGSLCHADSLSLTRIITAYNADVCAVDGHILKALDSHGQLITNFSGTVSLTSSDSEGSWSVRQGDGVLTMPVNNNGEATYKFSRSDNGQVTLDFVHNTTGHVTLKASAGGFSTRSSNVTFQVNNATPWKLEAGDIKLTSSNSRTKFQSVRFKQSYPYPPIVLVIPTAQDEKPVDVKVKNVTRTGFEISTVSYRPNQTIKAMDLKYVAVEPGIHEFADGTKVEACVVPVSTYHRAMDSYTSMTAIDFKQSFLLDPVVVNKLQSLNNTNDRDNHRFVNPWLTESAHALKEKNSIKLTLERAGVYGESKIMPLHYNGDPIITPEIFGYVAIERGVINFSDNSNNSVDFQRLFTGNVAGGGRGNGGWRTDWRTKLNLAPYSEPPTWVGKKVTSIGPDGGWLVRHKLFSKGIHLSVDEDEFHDTERKHWRENIALFVFDTTFDATIFPPVDHYRFEIPTTGLTCAASDIVLKACSDAACLTPSSLSSSLSLSPAGLWSQGAVISDNITFTGSTPTPGVNSLKLSQPNAVATTISASNFNPAPSSSTPVQCFTGGTAVSCSVLFKDTGFLFSNIPHQISNKSSLIGFNGQQLTIQAVEKNTTTGACQAIFPSGNDVNLELKLNCASGSCSNIAITTDSSATSAQVGSSYSNVPFNFAFNNVINNNVANYELNYANAGELSLSAQKVVTLNSGMTTTLEGTSNNFVVKPFGFKVTINDTKALASNANGTVFKKAGKNFDVDVEAIGWQSNQDDNVDGMIDEDITDFSQNPPVKGMPFENVKLSHELVLPNSAGVSAGSLAPSIPTAMITEDMNVSKAQLTASWSEVGIIDLTVSLNDGVFINNSVGDVKGYLHNVGRFTPHHFEVSDIDAGEFVGTTQCLNQTFIGELTAGGEGALNYGTTAPSMTITAKNSDGVTTVNYRDLFKKFDVTNIAFDNLPTQDSVNGLALTAVLNTGTVTGDNGVFTYTASADDHFVYTRNAASKIAPFSANVSYTASTLADGDKVGLELGFALPTLSATSAIVPQHLMRYGRVQLNNAFGPENDVLAMPIEHQFFDGSNFVVNPNIGAGCVVPVLVNTKFTLQPASLGDLDQAAMPNASAWAAGDSNLLIPPPNTAQGSVEFTLDVPSWLKFDWDNNVVTPDTDPKAKATFGRYRGNDRIINWRERR
ncbi:DUF6701 domain-containing protein [Psychrobium sp. nBUS_13]|uniref:DUF6701 domain-containing protein n=1 Tax=Psychrobium sp. nBUS_13 TaxID=3395319 RepID=UPI003EB864D3